MRKFNLSNALRTAADKVDAIDVESLKEQGKTKLDEVKDVTTTKANEVTTTAKAKAHDLATKAEEATRGEVTSF